MRISSSKLSPLDFKYFANHFEVKAASVSCLDEARIILIGERHCCSEHHIKRLWLLNQLACDHDVVYLETHLKEVGKELFNLNQPYTFSAKLHIKGWDSEEGRYRFGQYVEFCDETIEYLESCFQQMKKNTLDIRQFTAKMSSKFSELEESNQEILQKSKQFSVESEQAKKDATHIAKFLLHVKALKTLSAFAATASENQLKDVFFRTVYVTLECLLCFFVIQSCCRFYERNRSLATRISEFDGKESKAFIFAGQNHLCENKFLSSKESIGLLKKALEGKKYVILKPTESRDQIEHAEKFLKKFKHKMPLEIVVMGINVIGLGVLMFSDLMIGSNPWIMSLETYNTVNSVVTYASTLTSLTTLLFLAIFKRRQAETANGVKEKTHEKTNWLAETHIRYRHGNLLKQIKSTAKELKSDFLSMFADDGTLILPSV